MKVRIVEEGKGKHDEKLVEAESLVFPDDCPVLMEFEDSWVDVGRARNFDRDGDGVVSAEVILFRGSEFEPEAVTMELANESLDPEESVIFRAEITALHLTEPK